MSNSFISSLNFATSQTYIYMGIPIIIGGVFGGLLNTIMFLCLRIYRENSTAFYLTVVSVVNVGQLLTGLLSKVLISLIGVDWNASSLVYCKLRNTIFQACAVISPTCLCLVTIDQFLATSTRPQWRQWSHIKVAHRLSIVCIVFWVLYGIPYSVYYSTNMSSATGIVTCSIGNSAYLNYYNNVHIPVMLFALPVSITVVFGLLAYHNVRQLSYRTIPLVRRRHEVQLTVMVLVQGIFNVFSTTPVIVTLITSSHIDLGSNPILAAQFRFANGLTNCIYYLYYAIPFYIYICVSERFRKQLRYVIIDMHLNRWQRIQRNQVEPQQIQSAVKNEGGQITIENIELV